MALRRIAALAVVGSSALFATAAGDAARTPAQPRHQVTVGAILDLAKGWTALGSASRVTLQLAVADANAALARQGSPLRMRLRIVDAKGDPATANRQLQRLAARGIHVVIGPEGSSEVAAVRKTANRRGVVVISQGSTAHSLAIAGDNVLRFVPDDIREGEAAVALMRRDGVDAIVPVWREDAGNAGLARSVRAQFSAAGGKVANGVSYATNTTNYDPVAASISSQVAALRSAGAHHVGIYLAAFDDVVDVFHSTMRDPTLQIPWYGSDGVALTTRLLNDQSAATFAHGVGYPNPTVGLPSAAVRRDRQLFTRVHRRLGRDPDALALGAYDALRIVAIAEQRSSARRGAALRRAIVAAANKHVGATGTMKLNRAGDRAYGDFDFWSVCPKGNGFSWVRTFEYAAQRAGSGQIVARGKC